MVEDREDAPRVRVGGAVVTIGRVRGNDVVVTDPRISSRHGRLVRRGEGYAYEDLGSRNGSLLERAGERSVVHPHSPVNIETGDRLLLGDLVTPVILRVVDAPTTGSMYAYQGGTLVARRAVADQLSVDRLDPGSLRKLFHLLKELSGRVDPDAVMERIADAVLERFPQASSACILLRQPGGGWVPDCTRLRDDGGAASRPSSTLMQQAIESREVVAYLPGGDAGPESVAGLTASVIVPLLASDEAIGILHVDSRTDAFNSDALAWLGIVGTHAAANLIAARRFRALRSENASLRSAASMPRPIVGRSATLHRSLRALERVARTNTSVLVLGETGTGKELAARYVHAHSPRAEQIFAPVNCAALPENLLNSELFGHRKGAFTGAMRDHKGLFEAAEGGTVFLDEIGEISPAVQVRLLRVLQEREVQPVGSTKPVPVDVRIVAATNRDLEAEIKKGTFREDLYYRLAVFPVLLPPLRDREGDIEQLAERFRESSCARHDKWVAGFTDQALRSMASYGWPGNVRQLEHEVERAVILCTEGELITPEDLSPAIAGMDVSPSTSVELPTGTLREVMGRLEERVIRRALDEHGGNRTRTAETLGISRQALQAKLARWRRRDVAEAQ